jgi:molybdopterin-guanine dinucleotide biosynthesis protein A
MGRDKALLPFRGVSLAQHVARVLAASAESVFLVGNPEQLCILGIPVVPDLYPGQGPLGGILTALRHATAPWNFIAACDMPAIDGEVVEALFRAAEECSAGVLLPHDAKGQPQPLCAVYHRSVLDVVQPAFDRGIRKITAALEGVRTVDARVEHVNAFQNVNTPADWADYAAE